MLETMVIALASANQKCSRMRCIFILGKSRLRTRARIA
jgi:hypothetical protein